MRVVTIAGFIAFAIAMALIVLRSRREVSRLVPFSTLLDVVMTDRAARLTILLFWWWLGWHFLVSPP